jgi:hypothetical protein
MAFASRYAGFLCASHASFPQALIRLPGFWHALGRKGVSKPWRPVLDAALSLSAEPDGQILEFGVFKGDSIRHMAARLPKTALHGFDSFEGFPDGERRLWDQDFSVAHLPTVPANVTLHQGFFETTVPPFVEAWGGQRPRVALVHIDCDLFSSTHTVFTALGPNLRSGDVIAFDELMNYTEFATHEFLALFLLLEAQGLDFEWAATWGKPYPLAASAGQMLQADFKGYREAGYFQNQSVRLRDRSGPSHFETAAPPALIEKLHGDLSHFFDSPAWAEVV